MRFDSIDQFLDPYLKASSTAAPDYLHALERETWLKVSGPHMLTGFAQGRFLSFISNLLRPSAILEIGTFTGYGALCLAEGLAPNGKLITLESSPENAWLARKYLEISPYCQNIEIRIGKAAETLTQLSNIWDLVYVDADKVNNQLYFDLCWSNVRSGGIVLIDNVLANGGVLKDESDQKPYEKAVSAFNRYLAKIENARVVMLPIRDGLTMVQKIT